MSLEDELEPKLTELDRAARSQYAFVHLGTRGFVVKPGTDQLDVDPVVKGEVPAALRPGVVPLERARAGTYEATISGFADFPAVLWSTWQAIDKLEQ